MISNYEPLILLFISCTVILFNFSISTKTKIDIIFGIQTIVFIWFVFHFVHSAI
ncbi:Non-essential IMV membrane protein [NY_014 poxvirus]|uniref:Non-essential IMV membrane protein n=1 Tax=NY_014 poxvirus TaxID=2025360 RepID=UPI000B9A0DDE|nr:Non-essential IMV membrane protein [NY_014 poxvirus]AST09527.1 Non-essential IMV membrane protein [NY_014 poxvirus]